MKNSTSLLLTVGLTIFMGHALGQRSADVHVMNDFDTAGTGAAFSKRITVTIAGNGTSVFGGDGGAAKSASAGGPKDVCMDAAENLYFVDKINRRIRKVCAADGIITTIAGGGTSSAEGVAATAAMLSPNYMCIDPTGNLYVSTGNQIRKIDKATGTITTFAGTASAGYGGDGAAATLAALDHPMGICLDGPGNLYIVDRGNNRIRKITATTGIIQTLAGNGLSGYGGDGSMAITSVLDGPACVCVSAAGDVFFSDQNPHFPAYDNSVIRKIDAATGIVTTVCGTTSMTASLGTEGVPALFATLGTITGMCFGPSGNLFCCEMSCSCRELDFASDTLFLVGGNFASQSYSDDVASPFADMNNPFGLCVDNAGTVYVADSGNNRVRKLILLTPTPTFAYGKGQTIATTAGRATSINTQMAITDIDLGQNEKWEVTRPPAHGVLAGFPSAGTSVGVSHLQYGVGMTYTPNGSYNGKDSFCVRVSDGVLADTITIYATVTGSIAGINDELSGAFSQVNIFPNPASPVLNIQWEKGFAANTNVTIMDVTDKVFYKTTVIGNAQPGSIKVDISSFPAGVYMVNFNGSAFKTFVKQ